MAHSNKHSTNKNYIKEWNKDVDEFVKSSIKSHGNVDWIAVDRYRLESLPTLLAHRGLIVQGEDASKSKLQVKEGSLWDESQLTVVQIGMTEAAITMFPIEQRIITPGSVGRLSPGLVARVRKPDGSLAEYEEEGELEVKGPSVALGYANDEKGVV